MTYPTISPLPGVPNRLTDSPTEFSNKVDAFLSSLPTFRAEVNSSGSWMETTASNVEGFSNQAQTYATQAQTYATQVASGVNFKGDWSSLSGSLTVPSSVYWSGTYWNLLVDLADVTASEPGVSSDWVKAGEENPSFTNISFTEASVGQYSWMGDIDGDFYLAINATYDSNLGEWNRVDTSKPAWLYQHNITNNMIFESYKGLTLWRCQPGVNPISGFTTVGGWLMVNSSSEFGDYTLGGNGIEIDGNFTTPYGRVIHSTVGGIKYTGIATNVYLDFSNRDDTDEPSLFFGWMDDGLGNEVFRVRRAPSGASLSWTDLFSVSKDGNITFNGTITGNGFGLNNIPSSNVAYNNSTSGLSAFNVQDAIDELAASAGSSTLRVFTSSNSATLNVANYDAFALEGTSLSRNWLLNTDLEIGRPLVIINATASGTLNFNCGISSRNFNGLTGGGSGVTCQVDNWGSIVVMRISTTDYIIVGSRTDVEPF